METILISQQNFKTFKGAKLEIKGGTEDFILDSDTLEIESDYSNVSKRYLCEVSFDITKEQIQKLVDQDYEQVIFQCKKKTIVMNRVERIHDEEE